MKCTRCSSHRTIRFLDGFGQHRVFCRSCWGSWLEAVFMKMNEQKSLQEFRNDSYYRTQNQLGG